MVVSERESDIHEESYDRSNAAVQCMQLILRTCACTTHEREEFGKFLIDRQVE